MPMMDFLCSNGDVGLSLEDMIECDMNSEFSDQLVHGEPLIPTSHLTGNTSDCGIQLQHTGMDSLGVALALDDSKGMHDLSYLQQTVNVNEIQGIVTPENTDPNLLVNPQTGLPISSTEQLNLTVSNPEQTVCVTTPLTTSVPTSSNVQFVTATPVTSYQMSSTQNTKPTIVSPSTLRNIQNNTHSSISSVTTYHQTLTQHLLNSNNKLKSQIEEKIYPKPVYSYSCLIAMALKNSATGALPVSEIYNFMTENFPYFKNAPDGWKNSVRHNLSLNKCFEKIENPKATGNSRKGCLWGLNPAKIEKMEEEITKWRKKDPMSVKRSMARPDKLESLEKGVIGSHSPNHPNNMKASVYEMDSPETPTKSVQVSLIEIRPEQPIRTIKLDPAQVIQTSGLLQNNPIATIKSELVTIKHEADVSETDDEAGHDILNSSFHDPTLADIAVHVSGNNYWDELSGEGITLDDLPISSAFNFSFSGNSLTSSPATVQNVTGVGA